MIIESIPKSGRVGSVVYVNHPHWKIVRQWVCPYNPHTPEQEKHRENFGSVRKRWHTLTTAQQLAWRVVAANTYFLSKTGLQVRFNAYNFFVSLNTRRADLGLPQFDLPPTQPIFSPNPVAELALTSAGDLFTLKLRVPTPPVHLTLVQAAAPVSSGVRCVQHFAYLGPLPSPIDGWSDITKLYVARYGVPTVNKAVWVRTSQHIDGWTDIPKVTRARVLAPAA